MAYREKIISSFPKDGELFQEVEIYVDSESDIPEPKPEWVAGSAVIIMDTQDVKLLSTGGEWI
ncbi:MAG: hypothetical protein V3G42_15040 [Oscillospiraceae bacterium]